MDSVRPYEPRRFKSAVPFYERHRLAYPERLIRRMIALAGLEAGDPVLDLGTGPGFLAVPFARGGMAVTAADPEPAMLDAAAEAGRTSGVILDLWQGGSYELTPQMGPFRLVTIGRAFHWMDREATLAMLDRIVTPDGGVAFFHDAHPDVPENRWFKVLRETADLFTKDPGYRAERKTGAHRRYEPYLFASAFSQLDGLSVTAKAEITIDDLVGRAFSMSACAPERLGAKSQDFETALRTALAPFATDGKVTEVAEMVALLARRPKKEASARGA